MGQYPLSEEYFQESIKLKEIIVGPKSPDVALSLYNLGGLYLGMNTDIKILIFADWSKYTDAASAFLRSVRIYFEIYGSNHAQVAKLLNSLAALYQEQGDYNTSEILYHETLRIRMDVLKLNSHPSTALTLNDFGVLMSRMGL